MKKNLVLLIALAFMGSSLSIPAFAAVKSGAVCKNQGQVKTVSGYKYTCKKTGSKLVWIKGVAAKTNSSNSSKINPEEEIDSFELLPSFSMTTYSERLRRYKDRPDGYLYVEKTRGVVQILLPEIVESPKFSNINPPFEYFVVIGGGYVSNRKCSNWTRDLTLPLDIRVERDKKSVLYTLLPKSPKGLPVGIVFKIPYLPIAFTCIFQSETTYSINVVAIDLEKNLLKAKSLPEKFTTPLLWVESPPNQNPIPAPSNTISITPDAICSPEGTIVKSTDSKNYMCQKSLADGLLRWFLK